MESGGERGVQQSKSAHQNHRIVVVDGPELRKVLSWLGRSVAGGGGMLKVLAFSQLSFLPDDRCGKDEVKAR